MIIVKPEVKIIGDFDPKDIMSVCEYAARTCYQSYDKIEEGSAEKILANCVKRGHESVIEHRSITIEALTNRACTHQLVRHRLMSVSQQSQRYCIEHDHIKFIKPVQFEENTPKFGIWVHAMADAERRYFNLINHGAKAQEARLVLPNSVATTIVLTANLREWRHIIKLRTSKGADDDIKNLMMDLYNQLHEKLPIIFDENLLTN